MNALRPLPGYVAALLAAGAVTFVSSAARATCTTNAECGQGFTCEVVGGTACAGIACPDNGEPCPEQPPCEPQVIKDCVPGPCNADADCADGMVCYSHTDTICTTPSSPACPPGEKCEAPPPDMSTCTSQTEKQCVPRYMLPCTAAADCGTGFNCVLDQPSCWCSGSSGGGAPSSGPTPMPEPTPTPAPTSSGGGTDPVPPMPSGSSEPLPPPDRMPSDCGCTPATTNHCEPQIVNCNANSDCPSGWVCQNLAPPTGAPCTGRRLPDGGIETICEPVEPAPVQMQCVPPYYNLIGRGYAYDSSGSYPPGAPVPAQGGGTVTGAPMGNTNGETTGTPKSGSGAAPSASSGDTGGCQVGHGGTSAGASLLAVFGLLGLSRRKRSRVR